jgi:hypothetical protein
VASADGSAGPADSPVQRAIEFLGSGLMASGFGRDQLKPTLT